MTDRCIFQVRCCCSRVAVLENNLPEMGHQSKSTNQVTKFNKHYYESGQNLKKICHLVSHFYNQRIDLYILSIYLVTWTLMTDFWITKATFDITYFYLFDFLISLFIFFLIYRPWGFLLILLKAWWHFFSHGDYKNGSEDQKYNGL